ncbi:hypothetical protein A4X13_0g9447, partial [Tilletia indica]
MNQSLPPDVLDQIAREMLHFDNAPAAFLQAWKRGVHIAGAEWFGDGTRAGLQQATSKWQLRPNVQRLNEALGVLSSGQRLFLSAMVSFYNASEGGAMLKRCQFEGLADLGGLDLERRKVIAELVLHYDGWSDTMNSPINPFTRGYHGFDIQRVAVIGYDDRCPMTYLPLHASQSDVPDAQLIHRRCIFSDDFVLVTEGQQVTTELDTLCSGTGTILAVLYSIYGDDNGVSSHIGDDQTLEAAREVIQRLSFETGHYSRCWEISSAHVTEGTMRYLEDMAATETPTGLLFVAFPIPCSPAVGGKLIAAPWTS